MVNIDFRDPRTWMILVGLLFLLNVQSTIEADPSQKQSSFEAGKVGIGIGLMVVGIGLFFVPGLQLTAPVIIGIGLLWAFAGGSLLSGIFGLLTPDIGIPIWVWFIAGFILILMVLRKGKN